MPQREPEAAEADPVEAAQRSGEHLDGDLGREAFAAEHERGRREHRSRRRRVAERGARGVARGGHVGERESALERGHVGAGPHDDRHRRPRHAVEQVAFAQEPRDGLALGRMRRRLDAEQRGERVAVGARLTDGIARRHERRLPMRTAEGRADVRRDRLHEVAHGRAAAVHAVEHHAAHRGAVEDDAERAEQLGPAAAEAVARDVGVAERDDRDPPSGERAQHRRRGLGGLLRVVDDEQPQPRQGAERGGCLGVDRAAPHDRRGERAELGRVELGGAQLLLHLGVLGEESGGGHPLGARRLLAETGEGRGIDAVLDRPHHDVAQLGAEPAQGAHVGRERVGPCGAEAVADAALEELAHDLVVLRAGQQGDGLAGERAHELERQRVGRARERTARRDTEPYGELVAQGGGRCPRGRQHEHLVGGVAEPLDPVGHELDDEPRLAAARGPEHRRVLAVEEGRDGVQEGRGAGHA